MLKSLIAVVALATASLFAQTAAPAEVNNLYAVGLSYNPSASPTIAGSGLYAHKISDSGTYAFTMVDALPVSAKPFSVNTNFTAGIAQKAFTFGKIPVYVPTSAGVSYTGTNTGWSWSTGGMAIFPLKGNWKLMPNVRVLKSSVSDGAGYQPVVGVQIGFGQ